MADTLKSVIFQEGAPLDPNQLNDLSGNITTTFQASSLLNTTVTGIQGKLSIPLINSGRFTITGMKAGVNSTQTFSIGTQFSTNAIVTATPVSTTHYAGEQMTVLLKVVGNNNDVLVSVVSDSKSRTQISIQWTAVEMKPVA